MLRTAPETADKSFEHAVQVVVHKALARCDVKDCLLKSLLALFFG